MTGTFAGEYVMQGFLNFRMKRWLRILLTRSVALIPAVAVALAAQYNPGVEDIVDSWLNVVQSLQLPFALLPVLHFAAAPALMGQFTAGALTQVIMWILTFLVVGVNFYLVSTALPEAAGDYADSPLFIVGVIIIGIFYAAFIVYLMHAELKSVWAFIRNGCKRPEHSHPINQSGAPGNRLNDGSDVYFTSDDYALPGAAAAGKSNYSRF